MGVVESLRGVVASPHTSGGVRPVTTLPRMENELVKKMMWSGLLTAVGALASILTQRTAAAVWRRVFDEEPPE